MKCKKCGRETSSADGICGNRGRVECERLAGSRGDDAVLERVEASSAKPKTPPKSKKEKEPPPPPTDVEEFFTLAEALGLDAQKMLDGWCRQWVEKVRARALGSRPSADAPPDVQSDAPEAPEL